MKRIYLAVALVLSGCGAVTDIGDCFSHNDLAPARCSETGAYNDYDACLELHDRYVCEPMRQNAQQATDYRKAVKDGLIR